MTLHDRMYRTTTAPFELVACSECGLLRLHPQPTPEALSNAYPASYSPYSRPGISGRARSLLERRSVARLWRFFKPPRKVVDVGCANGSMLSAIRDRGNPDVFGVELDRSAARAAANRGIEVFNGTLQGASLACESVSTVVASHTIEHLDDPVAFLRETHRILIPGGGLLLWLPNSDSDAARILGKYWIGYDAPRHLTVFTVSTVRRALQQNGFRLLEVEHEAVGLEWAWALRLWARTKYPRAEVWLARLHPLLIVAATPVSYVSARRKRSGRIRIAAIRLAN